MREHVRIGLALIMCVGVIGCGDDGGNTPDAGAGSGGSAGTAGTGGSAGTAGNGGSSGTSGSGGTGGTAGDGGSGGTSGSGGTAGTVGSDCVSGCTADCEQGCFDLDACVTSGTGTLDLHGNVETLGAVVSMNAAPETAELFYRHASSSQWWKAPSMVRIPDGRLAGSAFSLQADSDYDVRVSAGAETICGSVRTLPYEPAASFSRELWVDVAAPNANGTGASNAPFQTIADAIDAATPGTDIRIRSGVYAESITITAQGSAGQYIRLRGEPGAILDSASTAAISWQSEGNNVWSTAWSGDPRYVSRDGARLYHYISLTDLQAGNGYNDVPIDEGFVMDGGRLYVRSTADANSHAWQIPTLNAAIQLDGASYVWIEGLEIRFYGEGDYAKGIDITNESHHVVIRAAVIHDIPNPIWVRHDSTHVRIEQNTLHQSTVYSWPWDAVKATDHENSAISLEGGRGAIVARNVIHDIFNGVYAGSFDDDQNPELAFDVDVYDNDLTRIGDDAFEPEGATINARFHNNRVSDFHNGVSLAPITFGPVWVLRNRLVDYDESGFKVSNDSSGRVWLLHNTCFTDRSDQNGMNVSGVFTNMVFRNNVIRGTSYAIEMTESVSGNDLDYDALYTTRGAPRIKWNNVRYDDLATMCSATQLECHSVGADPQLDATTFVPAAGSPLIDTAERIYGINDVFDGDAPDIGYAEAVP